MQIATADSRQVQQRRRGRHPGQPLPKSQRGQYPPGHRRQHNCGEEAGPPHHRGQAIDRPVRSQWLRAHGPHAWMRPRAPLPRHGTAGADCRALRCCRAFLLLRIARRRNGGRHRPPQGRGRMGGDAGQIAHAAGILTGHPGLDRTGVTSVMHGQVSACLLRPPAWDGPPAWSGPGRRGSPGRIRPNWQKSGRQKAIGRMAVRMGFSGGHQMSPHPSVMWQRPLVPLPLASPFCGTISDGLYISGTRVFPKSLRNPCDHLTRLFADHA